MKTENNCYCNTTTCNAKEKNGFLIVLVLYILLAIIIGSSFFY